MNVDMPDGQVFEWSKAIETGHSEIDEQHQKLFEFLRDIKAATGKPDGGNAIRKTIEGLKEYVIMHFQHEERIMDSFHYDQRDIHKRAHIAFIKKVGEFDHIKSSNSDICTKLAEFIYEWLISHIAKIDQVMVAKLNGRYQSVFTGDTFGAQTQTVIDNAFTLAGAVEQISVRLGGSETASQRRKFSSQLADVSERLINLIDLAKNRVETFGCSDRDLDRLRKIAGAVKTSVRAVLKESVKSLIDYGSAVIAGKFGLPFGVGAAMTIRVVRIGTLLGIVGGFSELDDALREDVEHATATANEVVALEGKAMPMPNFAEPEDTQGIKKRIASVGNAYDYDFIVMARKAGKKVADLLETAVDKNQLSLIDLFDEDYLPIVGSDPQQYTTKFLEFAEHHFPDIQEAILADNSSIVFAIAVDRNGYVPAHNKKYSFRQGSDPVWNAAHCRNRRIFDDRTGIVAAGNTSPILLQTYLRDMGGGEVAIMKDASTPITVKGRHWGAFRLGYQFADS